MSNFQEVVFSPIGGMDETVDDSVHQGRMVLSMESQNTSKNHLLALRDERIEGSGVINFNDNATPSAPCVVGGNSTMWAASMNFINSIVGAGIIGIPLAIQQCGFILGISLLTIVAYLVKQSVVMMIDCGIKANKFNLEELSESLLGSFGYYLAIIPMLLFAYGGQIAYLVIVGDTIPLVANYIAPHGDSIFHNREVIVTLFSVLIILPLCLLRDLSSLAWSSSLSIVIDIVLILVILAAAIPASKEQQDHFQSEDISELNMTLFAGVGTMSFAFVCQHNSFLVFRSLKAPTLSEWNKVAGISVGVSYFLSLTLGLIGFFAFYPYVEGDLLNNFPSSYASVCIARALLGSSMIFTYPMECYVARHCLYSLVTRKYNQQPDALMGSVHSNRHLLSTDSTHNSLHGGFGREESDHYDGTKSRSASKANHTREYEMIGTVQDRSRTKDEIRDLEEEREVEEEIVFNNQNHNHDFDISHLSEVELSDIIHKELDQQDHISNIDSDKHSLHGVESNPYRQSAEEGFSKFWHLTTTLFLWGSTLMVALVSKKLGVVSALTGAVAASTLGYTLPALIYVKTYEAEFKGMVGTIWNALLSCCTKLNRQHVDFAILSNKLYKFGLPLFMFIFGICTLIIGVSTILSDI